MALQEVVGTYGIVVMCKNEPNKLVAAKNGSPLLMGIGKKEKFLASDVSALLDYTRNILYLEDGEIAQIEADSYKITHISHENEIIKGLDAKGLVFLYAVPWPAQGLYSKKEISSVNDLKGLKFRAYNSATIRIAELTGMAPTKIEAAEISQAFSTGAVESMITSPTTGKNSKIWENGVKYFYDIAAWFPKNMVIVNKESWNNWITQLKI